MENIIALVISIIGLIISMTAFALVAEIPERIEDLVTTIIYKLRERKMEVMTEEEYKKMWQDYYKENI